MIDYKGKNKYDDKRRILGTNKRRNRKGNIEEKNNEDNEEGLKHQKKRKMKQQSKVKPA